MFRDRLASPLNIALIAACILVPSVSTPSAAQDKPEDNVAPPQYVPAGPTNPGPAPAAPTRSKELPISLHLVVPIGIDGPYSFGVGGQLRAAWEFESGLTPEVFGGLGGYSLGSEFRDCFLDFGARDPSNCPDDVSGLDDVEDSSATVWFGGGLRYMFFNPSALVPFIGIDIRLTIMGTENRATFGLGGTLGVAWEITYEFAIEVALQASYGIELGNSRIVQEVDGTYEGFDGNDFYLTPMLGFTYYFAGNSSDGLI